MTSPRLQAIEPQLAKLSIEEMRELMAELTQRISPPEDMPKKIDWNRFDGILSKDGPDPVEYQRAIRAEWDERGF